MFTGAGGHDSVFVLAAPAPRVAHRLETVGAPVFVVVQNERRPDKHDKKLRALATNPPARGPRPASRRFCVGTSKKMRDKISALTENAITESSST